MLNLTRRLKALEVASNIARGRLIVVDIVPGCGKEAIDAALRAEGVVAGSNDVVVLFQMLFPDDPQQAKVVRVSPLK